eukprot:SAG22_NODE_326_length_12283_cov_248.386408_6_plen_307_part_00
MSLDWQQSWPEICKAIKLNQKDKMVELLDGTYVHPEPEDPDEDYVPPDAGPVSPDTAHGRGSTCLMLAAVYGKLDMLKILLERGAELNTRHPSNGQTAYHQACYWNKAACAEALVRAGCDTGTVEKFGRVGRQLAERRKFKDLVKLLDTLHVVKKPEKGATIESQDVKKKADEAAAAEGGGIVTSGMARLELPKYTQEEQDLIARVPLSGPISESFSDYVHRMLHEPSTGLYFIHRHVRRTSVDMSGVKQQFVDLRAEAQQRCLDVDDITPLVDDINKMTHISSIRQLIVDATDTITTAAAKSQTR